MSKGTLHQVNKATIRPILVAGVEKRLTMVNALISFPLIASAHFHLPASLIGVAFFVVMQFILRIVSKSDPMLSTLFKRSTRYSMKPYFPAKSHPLMTQIRKIKSVSRPW